MSEKEPSAGEVVMLLGAGASFEAGLPLLDQLTEDVAVALRDDEELRALYRLLRRGRLLAHEADGRNVEDVLSAADALYSSRFVHSWPGVEEQHQVEPGGLANLGEEAERTLVGPRDFAILAFEVRKAIWRKLLSVGSVEYLAGMREVVDHHGPLTVASLNNDLVVETWAGAQGLALERGFRDREFDLRWIEQTDAELRLLKLHGSVDWTFEAEAGLREFQGAFQTAQGNVPMRSPLPELAVVFPSRVKVLQSPPLRELFGLFEKALAAARVLVVVGCKLGDDHVVESIVESCRKNESLRVLVVDPGQPEALKRLERAGRSLDLPERLDSLQEPFGGALAGGRLADRINVLRKGGQSPGRTLALSLDRLPKASSPQGLLERVEAALGEQVEDGWEDVGRVLSRRRLPAECTGPVSETEDLIQGAVGLPVEDRAVAVLQALRRQWSRTHDLAQAGDLAAHDGDLYFLKRGDPARVGRLKSNWEVDWIGPPLGSAGGLAVCGQEGYHFRKRLLGREGLAVLRRVDLNSGKLRWRLLRRERKPPVSCMRILKSMSALRGGSAIYKVPAKEMLRDFGFLSWPTTVRCFDDGLILVVESVQASVVEAKSARVIKSTGRSFLNLTDASSVEGRGIYLLEGGFKREGRIVLWRTAEGIVEDIITPLQYPSGMAHDPDGERLLITLGEPGLIIEAPLAADGRVGGEIRTVLEGLPGARWICQRPGGSWVVATERGLVGLRL